MEEVTGKTSCYLKIPFSDEIVQTSGGNFEWLATVQPDEKRKTYFESMWAGEDNLLREGVDGQIWGMTEDKQPRKARKGERAYYEFLHTIISGKKYYTIKTLFTDSNDGTSFDDLLKGTFNAGELLGAFKLLGQYKGVKTGDEWTDVLQPESEWEATIDVLLTVTEKDGKYTQTALADRFIRTGYTQGITRMEAQDAKRPFVRNLEGSPRKVHYSIQPKDFSDIPF